MRDQLEACGIGRGHRVAAQCDDADATVAWHAAIDIGAVIVPVDLCDLRRTEQLCCDEVDFVVAAATHDEVLEELSERVGAPDEPCPLFGIGDEYTVLDVTGAARD